jgi:hypothetical protein
MKTVLIAAVVLLAVLGVAIILAPTALAWWQGGSGRHPMSAKLPVELETVGLAVLGLAVVAALWVALG